MSIEGFGAACQLIENRLLEAIDGAAADLATHLGLPPEFRERVHTTLAPYTSAVSVALAKSLAAGETPEQFEARLATIKIEEP